MTKSVKLTEKELFLLLKQKNENAFSYLYDHYASPIYGILLREVKNPKLASEILKNTFVNIVNGCDNIECIKQSLFTWLLLLMKKTANEDFKVNIDLRSLINQQKVKPENALQKEVNLQTNSSSPFHALNRRALP